MSRELDTVFIQHKLAANPEAAEDLYQNDFVVIHYTETPISADPNEYKDAFDKTGDDDCRKAANKIKVLENWVREGKLVGADYGAASPELRGGMKVGKIEPVKSNQDPKISIIGCRGADLVGHIDVSLGTTEEQIMERAAKKSDDLHEVFQNAENSEEEIHIYKGIQLDDSRWVWYRDYPVLSAKHRRGTLCTWDNGDMKYLRAAYNCEQYLTNILGEGATNEKKARFLAPEQLEVVCLEYLRQEYRNFFQLFKIGGNLPPGSELRDVDIIGQSYPSETSIVAQVTHEKNHKNLNNKLEKLAAYARISENARLIFFGPLSGLNNTNVEIPKNIEYIPNGEVFEKMEELKPELLDAMLGFAPENETEGPL